MPTTERPVPILLVSGPTKSSGLEAGCFASSSDLQSFHKLKRVCLPPTGRSRLKTSETILLRRRTIFTLLHDFLERLAAYLIELALLHHAAPLVKARKWP
jgi:hypothetical protein